MDLNIANKPGETTPRLVKQLLLAAWLQYILAAAALWNASFGGALIGLLTGLVTQYLVCPLVHWYLTA